MAISELGLPAGMCRGQRASTGMRRESRNRSHLLVPQELGATRLRRGRKQPATRPPWMEKPSALLSAAKVVAIALIVLVMLYPFLHVIMFSFADQASVTSGQLVPGSFSIEA